jgi:hypothetical protein
MLSMNHDPERLQQATPIYQRQINKTPPPTLFHYTSQSGLIRLAESKSVSATNIHFFNDSEEFGYAVRKVRTSIYQRKLGTQDDLELQFYEYLPDAVERASHVNIHVFCMTESGDELSLWRGYCPGGNGLAIGFQWEQIKDKVQSQGFRIAKCIYDDAIQQDLISELLDYTLIRLHQQDAAMGSAKRTDTIKDVANYFVNRFWERAPIVKHPSFKEEREWRLISGLIHYDHSQFRIRPGLSTLTPYFALDISDSENILRLGGIVIGPTPHKGLASAGVTALVIKYGIKSTSIWNSSIPYRTW